MSISDLPLPNVPRALLDGELHFNKTRVPVLISPGNYRIVVLQSQALYELHPGQKAALISEQRGQQDVIIADVDRLAMVVRYDLESGEDLFDIPSPEA